ncbi:hypothetical protein BKA82DRAFT_4018400 [Pisolithus tinctorius]|nr:hypothetical protein BKA82DRAFT_4018400 [Pisolithus tinctorius]
MFTHFSSSLHLYSLLINPTPGECLLLKAWSLQELSWYGLAVGRVDETPSDGGATSYSATWGIEDCQLSLATLESIFYFPKETQLFTLHADCSLCLLDANWDSLARFLTILVNAAFSPSSIKADGFPWLPLALPSPSETRLHSLCLLLPPVLSSPSNTRVFSICPLVPHVHFLTFMVNGTFSLTSITPGEHLVHPLPSARGLVPLAALKGLEPSKVILVWIYPKLYLFIS